LRSTPLAAFVCQNGMGKWRERSRRRVPPMETVDMEQRKEVQNT
jgi:hypothetical protein